ncbi:uncharacterized protein LOC130992672 [Salvia miltiorrhiza]|uniref:uncharacterized protein LOC130992672 n=1 Tax=Salvia miltiorrhiza TaxID=226208 RepID=UPI0025AB9486|nr:uncharacterized protein LOC130992672 [Salvia miltiorrhiza]
MDDAIDTGYHPGSEFVEDKREPLIDLETTDSTELWLIQWPINQTPEFSGQQVSIKLQGDGHIGTFESSSGISYEMLSMKSQGPKETVFLSSVSEAKIAGKISKHVSLIHYPEPSELQKRNSLNLSLSQRSSMTTSTLSGRRLATPSRSVKPRNSHGMSGYSTPSSRTKSSVSGLGEPSKPPKRKRVDSAQDSGKTTSAVTSTDTMEQSQERKSKKKRKTET